MTKESMAKIEMFGWMVGCQQDPDCRGWGALLLSSPQEAAAPTIMSVSLRDIYGLWKVTVIL